jgi:serine/threonine protein phosphatase PrpC
MSWVDAFDPDLVTTLLETEATMQTKTDEGIIGSMLLENEGAHRLSSPPLLRHTDDHHALSAALTIRPGDRLLLMSDGLYGELNDESMREVLAQASGHDVAKTLLNRSLNDLAMDNISILVVEVDESTPNNSQ